MLPNGMEPPLKMLTTKQKIRATERMLNHFSTLSECSSDHVPGNYLAKQRRRKHDNSKMVFPEKKSKNKKEWKTNYTMNFKFQPKCRPSSPRPCSPTRRNNPHPSQVRLFEFCIFNCCALQSFPSFFTKARMM